MMRSRRARDNRIVDRLAGLLLQKVQHLAGGFAEGVGARPAGEALGHRIQEGDPAVGVADQDGIADARQRRGEQPPAFAPGRRHPGHERARG